MRVTILVCLALLGTVAASTMPGPSDVLLAGGVTDSSGAVIPNASVIAIPDGHTEPAATTHTDQGGRYTLIVKPGRYELRVLGTGFTKATKSVLAVASGEIPRVVLAAEGVCGSDQPPVPGRVSERGADPVATGVCDLIREPERFNGMIVSVRGRILIAFEEFRLDSGACEKGSDRDVWLEYGRGPKRQPTIWCCGDTIPRDPLQVKLNKDFELFNHYLSDQFQTRDCLGGVCSAYDVTATITGRFDTRATKCAEGRTVCPIGGAFGHMGLSCSRLVIRSVADVVAERVAASEDR